MFILKESTEGDFLISSGSLFHSTAAPKLKERSPYDFSLVLGISKCSKTSDLRGRSRFLKATRSHKYFGARLCIHLYVVSKTLKIIRSLMGSQCNDFRTGVMWFQGEQRTRMTILAAIF